jgi:hypothetical protein
MADCQFVDRTKWKVSRSSGIRKRTVLEMGAITGNGNAISRTGKLRVWVLDLRDFNRSEKQLFNPFDTSADDDILNVSSLR